MINLSTMTPLQLSTAIERYLQFLQSEENKSSLTVSNYRQSLALLALHCSEAWRHRSALGLVALVLLALVACLLGWLDGA